MCDHSLVFYLWVCLIHEGDNQFFLLSHAETLLFAFSKTIRNRWPWIWSWLPSGRLFWFFVLCLVVTGSGRFCAFYLRYDVPICWHSTHHCTCVHMDVVHKGYVFQNLCHRGFSSHGDEKQHLNEGINRNAQTWAPFVNFFVIICRTNQPKCKP